ncbi:MAG: hypothetical protein DWQ47_04585 [Acidobacteria bacterium]|nr:MAG: hypothetical protein DWQ32_08135 [Acidobacteriota bacterium]REK01665.1 MAG: hypothetical protein DWQ38_04570 [Acidobacteriota bacterium]REK14621.1 MAG: hypothetical protein DWQ43_13825 [Acidobacteriota bacterium]REK45336.1 MAG: hypothetical protein DWQ47_04585 [Acidobacteriota bacterium]
MKQIDNKRLKGTKNTIRSDNTDKTRYSSWDEFYDLNPGIRLGQTIKNQMDFLRTLGLEFTIDSPTNFEIFWNESEFQKELQDLFDPASFRNHRGNWNLIARNGQKFTIRFNESLTNPPNDAIVWTPCRLALKAVDSE